MMAMSFNENNYSVNYLIWDQETIRVKSCERSCLRGNGAEKYGIGVTDFAMALQMEINFISIKYTGEIKELRGDGTKWAEELLKVIEFLGIRKLSQGALPRVVVFMI